MGSTVTKIGPPMLSSVVPRIVPRSTGSFQLSRTPAARRVHIGSLRPTWTPYGCIARMLAAENRNVAASTSNDAVPASWYRKLAMAGPTTSETLEVFGFTADLMPSHPKMGFLVSETAAAARTILENKRA